MGRHRYFPGLGEGLLEPPGSEARILAYARRVRCLKVLGLMDKGGRVMQKFKWADVDALVVALDAAKERK